MNWGEFKAAVDEGLLTNRDRTGTETFKALSVRLAVRKLQRLIPRYQSGQQNLYRAADLSVNGFASQGTLPDNCAPKKTDLYIVRQKSIAVSNTVDATDDEITATGHGLTVAAVEEEVVYGALRNTGGALPTGITAGRFYFLRVVDGDTLTIHTTRDGALTNTDRVDITANGSGVSTLDHSIVRHPCVPIDWGDRYELVHGFACVNDAQGRVAFDQNSSTFLIYPQIELLDADGRNHYFELNWDGIKLDFEDADAVPFDDDMVPTVVEYVQAQFKQHVDDDLAGAEMGMKEAKSQSADLFLIKRRQR